MKLQIKKKTLFAFVALIISLNLGSCSWDIPTPMEIESKRMYRTVRELGEKEAAALRLELLGVGSSLHVDGEDTRWSLSFVDRRAKKLDEGRKDIIHIIDAYLKDFRENSEYERHMEWYKENSPDTYERYGIVTQDSMGVRLAYWDEETERRSYPYLAQIRVADSEIFYYYADPKTQELTEPVVETFEKARENVKNR